MTKGKEWKVSEREREGERKKRRKKEFMKFSEKKISRTQRYFLKEIIYSTYNGFFFFRLRYKIKIFKFEKIFLRKQFFQMKILFNEKELKNI